MPKPNIAIAHLTLTSVEGNRIDGTVMNFTFAREPA
jgi:hypothetical protein